MHAVEPVGEHTERRYRGGRGAAKKRVRVEDAVRTPWDEMKLPGSGLDVHEKIIRVPRVAVPVSHECLGGPERKKRVDIDERLEPIEKLRIVGGERPREREELVTFVEPPSRSSLETSRSIAAGNR